MANTNLHQRLLDDGYELANKIFNEWPEIHISFREEGSFLVYNQDNGAEKISDKPIGSFRIEAGSDVPEAKPEEYDSEEFSKRFLVYMK